MKKSFLWLAILLLLLGIIFPAYITWAIGGDIGDILEWSWGLRIIIPRDLMKSNTIISFVPFIFPWVFTIFIITMIIILFSDIKRYEQKKPDLKYINLAFAILLVILQFLYYLVSMFMWPISINLVLTGAIIVIINNLKGEKGGLYSLKRKSLVEWLILIGGVINLISTVLILLTFRNSSFLMIQYTGILIIGGLFLILIGGLIPIKKRRQAKLS
ncbi:MAG: hypothetical protein ACFE8M_03115 [Candidatus Hermodarchaeota archaeon]